MNPNEHKVQNNNNLITAHSQIEIYHYLLKLNVNPSDNWEIKGPLSETVLKVSRNFYHDKL